MLLLLIFCPMALGFVCYLLGRRSPSLRSACGVIATGLELALAVFLAFGPGRVILVIGANTLSGNEEEALQRIREQACGPNGKRLGLKTPCALTGKCQDCSTSQRMCNVFLKLERRPGSHPVDIILVDEPMGF